jgi:hypothetical protein
MAADLLSTIRLEIEERLSELRLLLAERERLLEAIDALEAAEARGDLTTVLEPDAPKSLTRPKSVSAKSVSAKSASPKSVTARSLTSMPAPEKPSRRRARAGAARRGSAAGAIERAASDPTQTASPSAQTASESAQTASERPQVKEPAVKDKPERAARGVARETILAALDHGSHTVSELAVVTAMSAPSINGSLRKLVADGAIVKTEREGKAAWALPEALL